jgi:predicted Zn finger-like uncharacterized protein
MKVACQHCGAAYSVADAKVAGRKLKLRCKKCSEPIVVDGTEPRLSAQPPRESARAAELESTPVVPLAPVASAAAVSAIEEEEDAASWHIAVGDGTQGPYTLDELVSFLAAGNITADTLVYRDGAADWTRATEVDELRNVTPARPVPPPPSVRPSAAGARARSVGPSAFEQPFAMGNDPFGEPAQSPRVSAADMMRPGGQHEGTVQFSVDQIRALSSVSLPNVNVNVAPLPTSPASGRPGYASGSGSGLIDVASLAAPEPADPYRPIVGSDLSPLDTMAPLALPIVRPSGGIDFRTKVFASLAALAFALIGGVSVLALTRRPAPVAAVAQQPVGVQIAAAAVPPPVAAPAPAKAEPEPVAVAEAAEPAAAADPETHAAAPAAARHSAKHASSKPREVREAIEAKPSSSKPSIAKASNSKPSSAIDLDDLMAKNPSPAPKKGGSASIDELLDGAVSAKKSPPKAEPAHEPKNDLPPAPSREDMLASLAKAKAKVQACKGPGVATAAITIAGSSGRATTVAVSGVEGAAKSCVEKAVRGTSFPKFQKATFDVKFPFKLEG